MERDDAAIRGSFAGDIYQKGIKIEKQNVLDSLPKRFKELHEAGYVHIHDLEGYDKVYNCCTPDLRTYFSTRDLIGASDAAKVMNFFNSLKNLITTLALNQTGGIGFANIDDDIAFVFHRYDTVRYIDENISFVKDCIVDLLNWINTTYTRYCREPYYLTFNMGLSDSLWGRKITELFLKSFKNSPMNFVRPNIVFKLNKKINGTEESPNFDLYKIALESTAKRMIPTYLLTESTVNTACNPENLSIMGCRTRVYNNCNGVVGTIGRGNLACISMNLPRLALESKSTDVFFERLISLMNDVHDILLHRSDCFKKNSEGYNDWIQRNKIWKSVSSEEMVKQGTLAFGFIGLSETVEILTDYKYWQNPTATSLAYKIVQKMRGFVDECRNSEHLNYSLLATPAEMLSGRFCDIDSKLFHHKIHEKGFYTNSFHTEVDSQLSAFDKIKAESPFHELCNGGCISYIEFDSAPIKNYIAIKSCIEFAESVGISYLGFNFPLDICNECGAKGTFNDCPACGSSNIKRIRRVSGYLEDLAYFTKGKTLEEKARLANAIEEKSK